MNDWQERLREERNRETEALMTFIESIIATAKAEERERIIHVAEDYIYDFPYSIENIGEFEEGIKAKILENPEIEN